MKIISAIASWAAKFRIIAILLIIAFGFTNIAIGIIVGSEWLFHFSPLIFMALLLGLVLLRVSFQRYRVLQLQELASETRFYFQKQTFIGLFLINLATFTVGGGILGSMTRQAEPSVSLYGGTSSSSETTVSTQKKWHLGEKLIQKKAKRSDDSSSSKETWRRIGYLGLFLLGCGLAIFGAWIACALACSEMGFAAIMVFLLTIGVFAGGNYFFGRAIDKDMKPFKDMTRDERKREKRRYFRTLLGTIGFMAIFILMVTVAG